MKCKSQSLVSLLQLSFKRLCLHVLDNMSFFMPHCFSVSSVYLFCNHVLFICLCIMPVFVYSLLCTCLCKHLFCNHVSFICLCLIPVFVYGVLCVRTPVFVYFCCLCVVYTCLFIRLVCPCICCTFVF